MGNPMGMMGNLQPTDGDRSTLTSNSMERTTGFEPATLTLAKKRLWFPSAESVPVP